MWSYKGGILKLNTTNEMNKINTKKPIFNDNILNILVIFFLSSFITLLPIISKCVPVLFNSTGVGDIKSKFFGNSDVFIALGSIITSAILIKIATKDRIFYSIVWVICVVCCILNIVCYLTLGEKYSVEIAFKWFFISFILSWIVVIMSQYNPRKMKGSGNNA